VEKKNTTPENQKKIEIQKTNNTNNKQQPKPVTQLSKTEPPETKKQKTTKQPQKTTEQPQKTAEQPQKPETPNPDQEKSATPTAPTQNKRKAVQQEEATTPPAKIQRSNSATNTVPVRFQRVDITKTKFGNKKLEDNSFASNTHQYGMKAAEDFGKVRGDRFKHEKTKKKRGGYKGKISIEVKSIPFDSDGEE